MRGKYEAPRKKARVGTVIFYALYVLGIAAFFVGLNWAVTFLSGWLTDYEAAQPTVKCQQVFDQVFAKPDWAAIYQSAGCEDTQYENAAHYAAYMEAKQGNQPLRYHETSAGLSDDKKYVVTLGDEKVAVFTLTSRQQDANAIPEWSLGSIEVFFSRQEAVTVMTEAECTVYINGIALTEDHVIQTLHTEAENYLPEGVHGLRQQWLYADGLLVAPQVTAVDANGQAVTLRYDEASRTYFQASEEMVMTQEQADTLLAAVKSYCRFMIRQESRYDMSKHFDTESEIYKTISGRGSWTHEFKSYRFTEPEFYGYYRYSDTLYSAVVKISMLVTSPWDSVKEYPVESTVFLRQQEDGKWLVCDMTNVDVQKTTTLVRLTYIADGQTIGSKMVDAAATVLTVPIPEAPEGKTFAGWYRRETDTKGQVTYSLAFLPEENGTVTFSGEQALESMRLYALFK